MIAADAMLDSLTPACRDAWVEGHNCALEGGREYDNPYPVGSDEAMSWNDGFASLED